MKRKMKLTAAAAALMMAVCSSCGVLDELENKAGEENAENAEQQAQQQAESEADSGSKPQQDTDDSAEEPVEEEKAYSWVIEPSIEAEDIFCPNNSYHAADTLGGYEYAVIMNDGRYSVIDRSGQLLSEEYADVFTMYESGEEDFGLALFTRDYHEVYSVNKNSGGEQFEYVFDDSLGQVVVDAGGYLPQDLESGVLQEGQAAAVKITSQNGLQEGYCIYADGAADTAAIYDSCAQPKGGMPQGDYAICVQKDGKWGYYNSLGVMILPCEYEANYYTSSAAYDYWQTAVATDEPQFEKAVPYLDSEGFLAVEKDGAAGYYDLNGEAVIELGEFEEARPVYGGTAWVKQGGKWGLIKLEVQAAAIEGGSEGSTGGVREPAANDTGEQTLAYAKIIDECKEICDSDPEKYNEFSRYYITDIDDDGVMELITDIGSCEADRLATVYTYRDGEARELGSFVSWRSYFGEGVGVLYSEATAMGSYTLSTIRIVGEELEVERGDAAGESSLTTLLTSYIFDDLTGLELIG